MKQLDILLEGRGVINVFTYQLIDGESPLTADNLFEIGVSRAATCLAMEMTQLTSIN